MNSIFSYWHFDMVTIIFLMMLTFTYFFINNFQLPKKSIYFFAGLLFFIIAVASPLHFLGMNYLFSAHMISHIIILLITAPLLVLSIPEENKFQKSLEFFSKKMIAVPVLCWFAGVGIMWFWHIPYFFNQMASMGNMQSMNSMSILSFIHIFSLLFAGILFSWVLLNPYKKYRINPLAGILYLSTACVFCSLLGLLITFAPVGLYTNYISMNDHFGFLQTIRNQWGISTAMDQQMAGMIMWVPCCFIYLIGVMFLLKKWFHEKEEPTSSFAQINLIK